MDFTAFSTRSKFAVQINAGYSARLDGKRLSDNPHLVWAASGDELEPKKLQPLSEKGHAWQHGWHSADKAEKSRGGAR